MLKLCPQSMHVLAPGEWFIICEYEDLLLCEPLSTHVLVHGLCVELEEAGHSGVFPVPDPHRQELHGHPPITGELEGILAYGLVGVV
jgi:hypothetical protein